MEAYGFSLGLQHDPYTGFSWFPCVYKQMLRWFPRFQVATTRSSCSPPGLNFLVTNFGDRLCGLVVFLATDTEVSGSIPGATRFSE